MGIPSNRQRLSPAGKCSLCSNYEPRADLNRLGRALKALHPTEAIAVAFVFGAGVGSILHVIFMIFLITIRLLRGGKTSTCAERRAARKARRAERKAIKAGGVRLEGEEGVATSEEVLPSYAEGETDRLVEKA